jgi:amino acid transporter
MILVALGGVMWLQHGSVTHYTWPNIKPSWDWDTVNFWSQIAFAFSGLELVSAMSGEVHDPRKTLPRAALSAAALIAAMYIAGTLAVLSMVPAADVDPKSGVFHAITTGSTALKIGFVGVLAALLVTVGNAGGVGSTVAGIARVPFVVGIDRYLPRAFGKIHPRWRTPHVSIVVQAVASALVLLLSQINESTRGAYQVVIDITIILYFIPFLYMFAAAVKLAGRPERRANLHAILIPGGKVGVWFTCILGFSVTLLSIVVSIFPPGDSSNRRLFLIKVVGCTVGSVAVGLVLYYRGARQKSASQAKT